MTFGYDKYATVNMQQGRLHRKEGIDLDERHIDEIIDKPFIYLGIEEIDIIQHRTTKEKLKK